MASFSTCSCRCGWKMMARWQQYRYMAAIPQQSRMDRKEKEIYDAKLLKWRAEIKKLRIKLYKEHMKTVQSTISTAGDTKEEEERREIEIEQMLNEQNQKKLQDRQERENKNKMVISEQREIGKMKLKTAENDIVIIKRETVLREIDASKNFITEENIDARIKELLQNPKDYNFAIRENGTIIKSDSEITEPAESNSDISKSNPEIFGLDSN